MDTITRRELLRRAGRAAIVGPLVLATREQQADLIYRLAKLCAAGSPIRRWLMWLWGGWW